MTAKNQVGTALRAAFPHTIPILAGFVFLGIAYGIFMNSLGFSAIYPILMSLFIYAGSMEFLAANLLISGGFNLLNAFFLTLMVNARHLFYGLSMLDRYKGTGKKKFYLIFGMCDESFSINCTVNVPEGVDRGWFMLCVTALNHVYWVIGAAIGGLFGSLIRFNTEGLEFVMTALFVVIFIEQWLHAKRHASALIGVGISVLCLILFGGSQFILPAMFGILGVLSFSRKKMEQKAEVEAA